MFDKEKFMQLLRAKLPNSDVFELTMEQKTAALNHLRAVNAGYSHAKGRTWIGRDYRPRIELLDAKKSEIAEAKKAAVVFGLAAVLVFSAEIAINQILPEKAEIVTAEIDSDLKYYHYDKLYASAPIGASDVQ